MRLFILFLVVSQALAFSAVSDAELAVYAKVVNSSITSISSTDWEFVASENRKSLNVDYSILPDKGRMYDRIVSLYLELTSSSMVRKEMVFHIVRPNPHKVATDVAMRDESNTVYFVEEFVKGLDQNGVLEAVIAHECLHPVDDGKRLSIVQAAHWKPAAKHAFIIKNEAHVDYLGTLALYGAGKDPQAMMRALQYLRKYWMDKEQYESRAEGVQAALDTLEKVQRRQIVVASNQ